MPTEGPRDDRAPWREVLRRLTQARLERGALSALEPEAPGTPEAESLEERPAAEPSALVSAGRWLSEALERLRRGAELVRLLRPAGPDRLVTPGAWTELELRVERPWLHGVRAVRFLLEGRSLGAAPLEEGGWARLVVRSPEQEGLHRLDYEGLDARGRVVLPADAARSAWVHVVPPERPVVLLDLDWALRPAASQGLHELRAARVAFAYLDVHETDRRALARTRMRAGRLPAAAVLSQPLRDAEVPTLG